MKEDQDRKPQQPPERTQTRKRQQTPPREIERDSEAHSRLDAALTELIRDRKPTKWKDKALIGLIAAYTASGILTADAPHEMKHAARGPEVRNRWAMIRHVANQRLREVGEDSLRKEELSYGMECWSYFTRKLSKRSKPQHSRHGTRTDGTTAAKTSRRVGTYRLRGVAADRTNSDTTAPEKFEPGELYESIAQRKKEQRRAQRQAAQQTYEEMQALADLLLQAEQQPGKRNATTANHNATRRTT